MPIQRSRNNKTSPVYYRAKCGKEGCSWKGRESREIEDARRELKSHNAYNHANSYGGLRSSMKR